MDWVVECNNANNANVAQHCDNFLVCTHISEFHGLVSEFEKLCKKQKEENERKQAENRHQQKLQAQERAKEQNRYHVNVMPCHVCCHDYSPFLAFCLFPAPLLIVFCTFRQLHNNNNSHNNPQRQDNNNAGEFAWMYAPVSVKEDQAEEEQANDKV